MEKSFRQDGYIINDGTIFDAHDVYVTINGSNRVVPPEFTPNSTTGDSRRKYRKYSKRVRSSKKSSKSRSRKYIKHT